MERFQRYSSASVVTDLEWKEGKMQEEPVVPLRNLRFSSVAISGAGAALLLDPTMFDSDLADTLPFEGYRQLAANTNERDRTKDADGENTMLACFLILVTDVVATLQSVALIILQKRGYAMLSLLLVSSLVGVVFSAVLMVARRVPLVRDPSSRCALVERGLLGGLANMSAFVAVSTLDLGVASCLMFTMPLWTALLAYVLIGQKWRPHDVLLALSCLAGVTLVTELWDSDAGVAGKSRTQWIGMGAALLFAIISADAALVVNTRLRGEAPLSMVFASMLCASVLAAIAAAATGVSAFPTPSHGSASSSHDYLFGMNLKGDDDKSGGDDNNGGDDDDDSGDSLSRSGEVALMAGLALSLPVMMLCRNKAFTLSSDTSVSMLLYLEIALAFVWQSVLLGDGPPDLSQGIGAALIVGGSCCSVALKGGGCGRGTQAAAGGGKASVPTTTTTTTTRRTHRGGCGGFSVSGPPISEEPALQIRDDSADGALSSKAGYL